ncbi:MAG: hypothetical protein IT239_00325 [Bacteroidia bacterium]|nr:hypothetical protein [Bacteroidia bacterium]
MKQVSATFFNFFVIVFSVVYMASCKPGDPPKLVVTVLDSAKNKVSGANIKISSSGFQNGKPKKGEVTGSGVTGSDGTASFEFKLDGIVKVDAYIAGANGDSIKGSNMGKLITGQVSECEVVIRKK